MTRYRWLGILDGLGLEVMAHLRVAGLAGDTVYFEHLASRRPVTCEKADTLVLASAYRPRTQLQQALSGFAGELRIIGDCRGPRTAEEAVYEGLMAGLEI